MIWVSAIFMWVLGTVFLAPFILLAMHLVLRERPARLQRACLFAAALVLLIEFLVFVFVSTYRDRPHVLGAAIFLILAIAFILNRFVRTKVGSRK